MSLIKTYLHQQQAIEDAKLELLEYTMFGSLSPINYDYHPTKETKTSQKAET